MTNSLNQFTITKRKGDLTLSGSAPANVLPAIIYLSSVNTFVGGTAVKLVDVDSNGYIVVEKAAASDAIFGFVKANLKNESFVAGDIVEVCFDNVIMLMEASEAIAVGNEVEQVATGDKIAVADGVNTKIGIALRKASADADIIPVLIKTPAITQPISYSDLNGTIAFTDLSDTPATYDGSASDTVKVNGTNDGLEFVTV